MSAAARKCPDCGERLSVEADRCGSCGWKAAGARDKRVLAGPRHDMTCSWRSGSLQCRYPCARFELGATTGFCIFHRATPDGFDSATIAKESQASTAVEYEERAKRLVYGESGEDNANVRELRARLRARADGEMVGLFATRILGARPQEQEEPGANG